MLTSYINALRSWLRDEPPRWDEAKAIALAEALAERDKARKDHADALDRLDACKQHAASNLAVLEDEVRKVEILTAERDAARADLARSQGTARKAVESCDARLRETLDELQAVVADRDLIRSALGTIRQVLNEYDEMMKEQDGVGPAIPPA